MAGAYHLIVLANISGLICGIAMTNSASLTNQDPKFWEPRKDVLDWLTAVIPADARVLDVGPGTNPFERADMFVDWAKPGDVPDHKFRGVDIHRQRLPFEDKTFDFVYCRHVLEDLYNPFLICSEMSRVAKAGYIETPSPLSEVCRGIDGKSLPWRGYHHHRFLVWNRRGVLHFLTKYPIIEYLTFENEAAIVDRLRGGPRYWDTQFLWRDRIDACYLQHEVDFRITENYAEMVLMAMSDCLEAADAFSAQMENTRSL
jgi:hypothetical protein